VPFWRRKPLHERLAEEGGLGAREPEPHDVHQRWPETGIHGVPRPRRWDAVASAEAPGLAGSEVHFVALPDGSLVVDEEIADGALEPLAEAVEGAVDPPYRAEAVRRGETVWAVAATAIEVVELRDVEGDALQLAVHGGGRALSVDGKPAFGSVPALERLAAERGQNEYVLEAERVDGDLWEVRLSPL
jgi:hypothetical protein